MAGEGIILLDKVDSTNTYARNNFDTLADGSVVFAREQTAGRGRLGRKWVSKRDESITGSAVLKKVSQPFHAGIVTGLAGLELVRECVPQAFSFFKWPNDIYIDDCKIAGILSEGVLKNGRLDGVVSGIGINVNGSLAALRGEGVRSATLSEVAGTAFFVEKLRVELAKKIKKYYIICQSNPQELFFLWRKENRLAGETLTVVFPSGKELRGVFCGIADSGEMVMRGNDGNLFRFDCGDVKIDTTLINFKSLKNKHTTNN